MCIIFFDIFLQIMSQMLHDFGVKQDEESESGDGSDSSSLADFSLDEKEILSSPEYSSDEAERTFATPSPIASMTVFDDNFYQQPLVKNGSLTLKS